MTMRVWMVGLFCALIGGASVWKGATQGAWIQGGAGIALVVASLAHIARPGRKTIGLVQFCWGALILGSAAEAGRGVSFESARFSGRSVALVVGGILVIAGISNLLRRKEPQSESPAKSPR